MLESKVVIGVTALVSVAAIQLYAISQGINGGILTLTSAVFTAVIGLTAGLKIAAKKN